MCGVYVYVYHLISSCVYCKYCVVCRYQFDIILYSVGLALRQYGACPWDYSERSYNLLGLITLEYFPAWYLASLLTEQLLIHNLLFLSLTPQDSHNRLHHKG